MNELDIDIVQATFNGQNYSSLITAAGNSIISDEPMAIGGQNKGFNPYELLIAGLASCTIATIKMYLDRKGWKVESIDVNVELKTSDDTEPIITRNIFLKHSLEEDQLKRVLSVANACPVHKLLTKGMSITSSLNQLN